MTVSVVLGPRLQTVASFVPEGARLGDIGTDHAYLPVSLYEAQRIVKAVAVDIHEGPYQSALAAVKGRNLEAVIDVRFGDGLLPLKVGEVNVLTLAGMGGRTMLEILSARPDILKDVNDLIVQPQGAEGAVRLTLLNEGWRLNTERLVEEEKRIYVVMAFSKEIGRNMSELLEIEDVWYQRLYSSVEKVYTTEREFQSLVHRLVWQLGPLILEERTNLLNEQINEYKGRLLRQIHQMKKSENPEIMPKIKEVSFMVDLVEGLRKWQ